MATQPHLPICVCFGPFEVRAAEGELRRKGIRVRLSGQPFQALLILLARQGEIVTREQLCAELWREGTFVDFEHGLNAAMNKLRRALGDSAENPRYIETVPSHGYRFIGTLTRSDPAPVPLPIVVNTQAPRKHGVARWWSVAIAVGIAISIAVGLLFYRTSTPSWKLTRLTADAGLSDAPALSPDGKLLAYSSDRDGGGRDLYIKQVSGGQPIRLTFDGEGNTSPDFSPDGSKIVFRSNRNGGGIYEIPAFGGETRLLAREGLNPKFSPDGSRVAYWIGAENVAARVPGSGTVWVVPSAGGQPRQVGLNFTTARNPIWSPNGRRLLFIGYTSEKPYAPSSLDWWILDLNNGSATSTGASASLIGKNLHSWTYAGAYTEQSLPEPACWSKSGLLTFNAATNEISNLWQLTILPTSAKPSGPLRMLTTGAGNELRPSCAADGTVAITKIEVRREIWSLPFDANRENPGGTIERIAPGPAFREHASLSADGRFVAFASDQSGQLNIWTRDLQSGQERSVAESPLLQRYPVVSPSGGGVAYSVYDHDKRLLYVSASGGAPEKVCEGCLRATDWSRDERTLLVFSGNPYRIESLDLASHQRTPLLQHSRYNLLYARYSPDNRWVSFTVRTKSNLARIEIAPLDGVKPVAERSWIPIAEGSAEDWANWSLDGKTLYFTSPRDGHFCLWGQRLDANTHRPLGEAVAVQHLHGRASYQQGGWSAAGGRIAMVLREDTGNIWMMSHSGAGE
jgi:eukaryotic-like serine/threonine-protein kinase